MNFATAAILKNQTAELGKCEVGNWLEEPPSGYCRENKCRCGNWEGIYFGIPFFGNRILFFSYAAVIGDY